VVLAGIVPMVSERGVVLGRVLVWVVVWLCVGVLAVFEFSNELVGPF
jgi:hypothetical protein